MAKRITSDAAPNQVPVLASSAAALLDETPTAPIPASKSSKSESPLAPASAHSKRLRAHIPPAAVRHNSAGSSDEHGSNHQAELFYLQKQIQQQTQMIFILEDGSRVQGIVEWYDRSSIKVRGKSRVLIYKSAIKYLYKAGEVGTAPGA